jgi:asparagine N-glycosylation enzyme membrane subunit Stt3
MQVRRAAFLLGLAAALAIGTAARLSTRAQLTAGGTNRVLGSDDAYHMRRAVFAVANFPRTILFDPLMNFPEGGVPIWPPLFDLALAAPSRILHGATTSPGTIAAEAEWVPLLFAGAAIALAGILGRQLFGEAGGVVAAFFVALCPGHILWTQFGHTDQHVAESATGMLALWTFVRCREQDKPGGELAAGLALALAVLTWQGAIYWGAIFALALFFESLLLRKDVLRPTLAVLALPAALTAAATAAWLGPLRPPVTYISFGFFQPLFLAALAAGTLLLGTVLSLTRRQVSGRPLAIRLLLVALAAGTLLPFAGSLLAGLANGIGYVLGTTREIAGSTGYISYPAGWLKGIFEARPLLADGPALALRQLSAAFFLMPLVILAWAIRAIRGPRPTTHTVLAIWGAVTLFLALSQRLNVYYAAPLVALGLVELFGWTRRLLTHGGPGVANLPIAGAATVGALLLFPMAPGLLQELRAIRVPGSDLFDTFDWMKHKLPRAVDAYDPRLMQTPPGPAALSGASAVLAPWSLGHLILYNAEQPVVANNFGYGFLDSIRFFLAESPGEALAIARRRHVRWVLVTDLAPRLNDYAAYVGRPPYLQPGPSGTVPTPAYFRTMQSRLYDFDAAGASIPGLELPPLSRFRLVFRSRSAISRGGKWLARWKVFEIVTPREP